MIIAIGHIKGGTGKTTTAVQVALQLQYDHPEKRIWLLDADSQNSALNTAILRSEAGFKPDLICSPAVTGKALIYSLNSRGKEFDDVIIDCGGRDSETLRIAMLACDRLVVPVSPGAYDVWALDKLLEVVNEVKLRRDSDFEVLVFVNKKDKTADCREAIEQIKETEGLTLMDSYLSSRVAYSKSSGNGKAVQEMKPKDKTACLEIEKLTKEVFKQ